VSRIEGDHFVRMSKHRNSLAVPCQQLRELGRAVPRRARAQPGKPNILGLTGREHEVRERVAAGKRNREIAEALLLSPRTVDRHLARIFQKLNVHSRAAATSEFERANQ
jgi:DNA-binding NarL/FixJ family response regulator